MVTGQRGNLSAGEGSADGPEAGLELFAGERVYLVTGSLSGLTVSLGAGSVAHMSNTRDNAKPVKAGLMLARQAFIYGEAGGDPVIDINRLIALSGVSGKTIQGHISKWAEEREQKLIERGETALGYHLSGETLEKHKEDVEFLRAQTESLKNESENLEILNDKLLDFLENLSENLDLGPDEADKIISLAKSYFATTANRQKVLSLFLAVQKRWQESSGMASQLKAWETGQREEARGRARVQTKRAEVNAVKDGELELVSTAQAGVFARRKKAPQV